jgi:hypothetical protein
MRIYAQVRAKAEVYALTERQDRWEKHVLNRLEREANPADPCCTGAQPPA